MVHNTQFNEVCCAKHAATKWCLFGKSLQQVDSCRLETIVVYSVHVDGDFGECAPKSRGLLLEPSWVYYTWCLCVANCSLSLRRYVTAGIPVETLDKQGPPAVHERVDLKVSIIPDLRNLRRKGFRLHRKGVSAWGWHNSTIVLSVGVVTSLSA